MSHNCVYNLFIFMNVLKIAAEKHGIIYIMSTAATCTIEEVHEASPNGINFLQLYIFKDR